MATVDGHKYLSQTLCDLITAFHILHYKGVVDAYGHVAVRNPLDPTTFFSSSKPANLISNAADLLQWNIDGSPVKEAVGGTRTAESASPYSEHRIHSCIFTRFPAVTSVVHSHSYTLVVCGLSADIAQRISKPLTLLAGFLGQELPIFDTAEYFETTGRQEGTLLINSSEVGEALAAKFGDGAVPLVLMRGHGAAVVGASLADAVYRAVYAQVNAEIAIKADALDREFKRLTVLEAETCANTINYGMQKAWPSWKVEVERSPQYRNEML